MILSTFSKTLLSISLVFVLIGSTAIASEGGVNSPPQAKNSVIQLAKMKNTHDTEAVSLLSSGFTSGHFVTTSDGLQRGLSLQGNALMARSTKSTEVSLQIFGLPQGGQFMSHVHNLPCGTQAGGSHYKIDPAVTDAQEANEIWFTLSTSTNGYAIGVKKIASVARPEAQSIVIHDTDGVRIACADLYQSDADEVIVKQGKLKSLGTTVIDGSGQMSISASGSQVQLLAKGLTPDTIYPAHVHTLPCKVQSGGGHYKIDPNITSTFDTNEVWLSLTANADGISQSNVSIPQKIRPEGQSIVIHDATSGQRLACVDLLAPNENYSVNLHARFAVTVAGYKYGYENVSGNADLNRSIFAGTSAMATVSGLKPNTQYMGHLHDSLCSLGGGGHYKIDPTLTTAEESNEMWFTFRTNRNGYAKAYTRHVNHIARSDARSIVIHDADDPKVRVACANF